MKFKNKKNTKLRGSKTHSHGAKKKWRGSGNRGGFGMAGTGKRADQKKTYILKHFGNSYFGKQGFHHKNKKILKTINVFGLNKFKEDSINLKELGYDKLLGKGNINRKLKINVDFASKKAIEKIQKSGGEVIIKQE
tara:strand:- start:4530 stop:4937 length:408 start_codon:yes stop_codon:yes gene_type:complete